MGTTEVAFGRTELSLRLSWIEFRALFHRRGSEGPGGSGMPEKFDFHMCVDFLFEKHMKTVHEHGWMSVLRAENDTR